MKRNVKIIILVLALTLALLPTLSSCTEEVDDRPLMPLAMVGYIADLGKTVEFSQLDDYKYDEMNAENGKLCFFELDDARYTLFVGIVDGDISYIMLSHNASGEKLYIFHKNPGSLGEDAMEYEGEASSYDVSAFIKKMSEDEK